MADDGNTVVSVSVLSGGPAAAALAVVGALDIAGVATVSDALAAECARCTGRLTLDLAGVTFVDSAGIAMLIQTSHCVGELRLIGIPDHIDRVLELTGLLGYFGMGP